MANLEVNISAKVRQALKSIELLQKEIREVGDATEEAQAPLDNLGARGARPFRQVKKGAANATPTLIEFNRVIQDAPFGIQGIANNITQLTQNFGDLRRSAGGTRAALSSLIGSFAGPAGILFVVSAATSLLVAFGDKLNTSKNAAKELEKEIDNVNRALDLQLKSTDLIEQSLKLQGKSVKGILATRQQLRVEALETLAGLIDQTKENLNLQIEENKRLSGYEAISGVVSEIVKKLGVELGLAKALDKLLIGLAASQAVLFGIEADTVKQRAASVEDKQKEADLQAKVVELENRRRSILNDILKTNQEIFKINIQGLTPGRSILDGLFQQTNFDFGQAVVKPIENSVKLVKPLLANAEIALREFNTTANDIINNQIAGTFASLGEAIGNALAVGGNVIKAAGASLLSSLGSILVQLGKMAIQIGIGLLGIKKALASLNPVAAIAAGAALVALGSFFKGKSRQISSNIGGSGVGGQSSGGSFSPGGSTNFTGSSGFGDGRVVFEIAGTKLVGVLSRTLARNQRIGGGTSLDGLING